MYSSYFIFTCTGKVRRIVSALCRELAILGVQHLSLIGMKIGPSSSIKENLHFKEFMVISLCYLPLIIILVSGPSSHEWSLTQCTCIPNDLQVSIKESVMLRIPDSPCSREKGRAWWHSQAGLWHGNNRGNVNGGPGKIGNWDLLLW